MSYSEIFNPMHLRSPHSQVHTFHGSKLLIHSLIDALNEVVVTVACRLERGVSHRVHSCIS